MHSQIFKSVSAGYARVQRFTVVGALALVLLSGAWAQERQYSEAPQLRQLVEAGQLPPVEERLPVNPLVVEPVERIGEYGGEWRTAIQGADTGWLRRTITYTQLVRWNPDWTAVVPDVAESWEVSEDASEYTFRLREGLRWSDGELFTADDIMFWYEDVLMNAELNPAVPAWLMSGGEPVVVEKVDDVTVVFRFAAPNGLLLNFLAVGQGGYGGEILPNAPRHYLEQFHINYNPDGIEALMREEGVTEWIALFQNKASPYFNPELPVLNGWILTTALDGTSARVIAERNPYFFKVDPEGNQLPYLDRVVFDAVEDAEVRLLKILNGEIDLDSNFDSIANRSLLVDNMERGGYRFYEATPAWSNTMLINLNQTHKDPVKREIFQNKDFRIGLSHAINRQEIIDLILVGQGEPWQAAPRPGTRFYDEELAKQYTEYDVDLANDYLDRAGYAQRDSEGFRLGPDGRRISFTIETSFPRHVDILELVQMYWAAVGVDAQIRFQSGSLIDTRMGANEHDAITWVGGGGLDQLTLIDPKWYFPQHGQSSYATAWALWYLNPNNPLAEEPSPAAKRQMELYAQLQATVDPDEQAEFMRQILEIAKEQFYIIGTSLEPTQVGIARNNFRNVPEAMARTALFNDPGPTNPEQYFIDSSMQ